jgi:RNA polymerase sigma factor for flagellar operon FliA
MEAGKTRYRSVVARDRRDSLVSDHLGLVRQVLGRLLVTLPKHVDRDNLEGAGLLGLVEAAAAFDSSRGCDFRSFATLRIRGEILDELRRNCAIPQQLLQNWRKIQEARQTLGEQADPDRIATVTGLSVTEISECEQAVRLERAGWADELESAVDANTLGDDLRHAGINSRESLQALADAIEQLPEPQRVAITLYYTDGLRLREIGEVMDLSEARVCRILQAAEEAIRREMRRRGLLEECSAESAAGRSPTAQTGR